MRAELWIQGERVDVLEVPDDLLAVSVQADVMVGPPLFSPELVEAVGLPAGYLSDVRRVARRRFHLVLQHPDPAVGVIYLAEGEGTCG